MVPHIRMSSFDMNVKESWIIKDSATSLTNVLVVMELDHMLPEDSILVLHDFLTAYTTSPAGMNSSEMLGDLEIVHHQLAFGAAHRAFEVKELGMLGLVFIIARLGLVDSHADLALDAVALLGALGISGPTATGPGFAFVLFHLGHFGLSHYGLTIFIELSLDFHLCNYQKRLSSEKPKGVTVQRRACLKEGSLKGALARRRARSKEGSLKGALA